MAEWFSSLRKRLRALVRRGDQEQDLHDEIAFHLSMREAQLRASGALHAHAGARRRFGNAGRVQEEIRDAWAVVPRLGNFVQDLRHAARALRRSAAFAAVVILTLGFGIGANTAVFSIVNAVLVRPSGFADADRLVFLHEGVPAVGINRVPFSPADLDDVTRDARTFDAIGAFRGTRLELSGSTGEAERLPAARITANLFPLLGVQPALGRMFSSGEDRPGHDVAVISWALWQRRYAGNPAVLGQTIVLDRRPYTLIGVMPRSFVFPRRGPQFNNEPADIWLPMAFSDFEVNAAGGGFGTSVIARLKDGASVSEAQSELDVLEPRVQEQYPVALRNRDRAQLEMFVTPLADEIIGSVGRPVLMLLGAVGLVLLVACANVANLLLSRAVARQHEVSLRLALGASRMRMLQQQLSEPLLLSLLGGALGVLVARLALASMPATVAERIPGLDHVPIDLNVLAFTAALSVATALLVSILPLVSTEGHASPTVRENAERTTTGRRRHRIQSGLVVSTVALSFALLVGAGLFIRSFSALVASDQGFRPAGVLTASVTLPWNTYPTHTTVRTFRDSLMQAMATLPGVRSAALTSDLPLEGGNIGIFTPEGVDLEGAVPPVRRSYVHGDYFQTLGIELRRGRTFIASELADNRRVVIVNEKLANRYWPGQDPIGKRLKWGAAQSANPWLTIVGVVSDTADGGAALATMGDDRPVHAYEPFLQIPEFAVDSPGSNAGRELRLALLAQGDPTTLAGPLRRAVAGIDPQIAMANIATMEDRLSNTMAPRRFSTTMVTMFAGVALFLASIGLYGLLAFTVAQQKREIGVRMALGAEPRLIRATIVGRGLRLVGAGIVVGLAISLAAARSLSGFLYETASYDAITFAGVPIVLAAVALVACLLPAYRASRVDPIVALRAD